MKGFASAGHPIVKEILEGKTTNIHTSKKKEEIHEKLDTVDTVGEIFLNYQVRKV